MCVGINPFPHPIFPFTEMFRCGISKDMMGIEIGLIEKLLGYLFSRSFEERARVRKVSDLALGFKVEIKRIKEEIEKRIPLEQPQERWVSGNIESTYVIPETLGKYYQDNIGKKGTLGNEDLINKIDEYYDKFDKWKIERLRVKEDVVKEKREFNPIREPLKAKKDLEEWLIKTANELENDLQEKIKN